jgi:hypothetical protein
MNTDLISILAVSVLALAIWARILYSIIKSASNSKKLEELLTYQTRMLMVLMKEKGISDDKIKSALDFEKRILGVNEPEKVKA